MTATALATADPEAPDGAGTQTDLKAFHTLGVYGYMALACIVPMDPKDGQNHRFVPVDLGVIADQIEACTAVHSRIDVVKISMLGAVPIIDVVEQALGTYDFPTVVLDPILIRKSQEFRGALEVDNALRTKIPSRTMVTTLNLSKTATLAGMGEITTAEQLKDVTKRTHDQGAPNVPAKVGPSLGTGTALDVFYDGTTLGVLEVEAVGTERVHGAGCTLAAAVTVESAEGASPLEAIVTIEEVVSSFIWHGLRGNMSFLYVYQGKCRQG